MHLYLIFLCSAKPPNSFQLQEGNLQDVVNNAITTRIETWSGSVTLEANSVLQYAATTKYETEANIHKHRRTTEVVRKAKIKSVSVEAHAHEHKEYSVKMAKAEKLPLVNNLFDALGEVGLDGVEAVRDTVNKFLRGHKPEDFGTSEEFAALLMDRIGTTWSDTTAPEWTKLFESYSEDIYLSYLADGDVPNFELEITEGVDKAIAFANRFEPSLLTSLWSDPARIEHKRMSNFLKRNYIENPGDIFGRQSKEQYEAFIGEFGDLMSDTTRASVERIQNTYVQRMRNSAYLEEYMQAGITKARIDTTPDACFICVPYQGRVFEIFPQYLAMINDFEQSSGEYLERLKSRGQSIRSGNWSATKAEGGALPPFHPNCKHSVEVVIEGVTDSLSDIDAMASLEELTLWAENFVADRVDISAFMPIDDMKITLKTVKSVMDEYGLQKLDFISEYVDNSINAAFGITGNGSKGLLIGKRYSELQEYVQREFGANHLVAQNYEEFWEGVVVHEMGHYLHAVNPRINEVVTNEFWDKNKRQMPDRSLFDKSEFIAEAFTAYRKYGSSLFGNGFACPVILSNAFDKLKKGN